jgi:hypothetical protein
MAPQLRLVPSRGHRASVIGRQEDDRVGNVLQRQRAVQ